MRFPSIAMALGACLILLSGGSVVAETDYQKSIDDWHEWRVERLHNPTGWLSLVGLEKLSEGDNRIGSGDDCSILLPSKAPEYVGNLYVGEDSYRFTARGGANVTHDGDPVDEILMRHDQLEDPTVLAVGSLRFYVIERSGEAYVRVKDTESELLSEFEGIERWPVDPAWRIEARFEPYDPPKTILIPDVLGNRVEEVCPGAAVFEVDGKTYRLEPTLEDGSRLSFMFGDATNGVETYGGGRFVKADLPENGVVVLDFNLAYNPPCVFTPYATCPLPRTEDRLDLEITAGEKMWGEDH